MIGSKMLKLGRSLFGIVPSAAALYAVLAISGAAGGWYVRGLIADSEAREALERVIDQYEKQISEDRAIIESSMAAEQEIRKTFGEVDDAVEKVHTPCSRLGADYQRVFNAAVRAAR